VREITSKSLSLIKLRDENLSLNARDILNSNIHYRGITLERTSRFIVIGLGFIGARKEHARKENPVSGSREKGSGKFLKAWKYRVMEDGSDITLICHEEIL
jgi:hypothetical protein